MRINLGNCRLSEGQKRAKPANMIINPLNERTMKTNRLFLALAFVAVLGGSSAFAQNTDGENNKPADKQRKRPTPEQMMEFQTKRMEQSLMLDDKTAAKFTPLYKEYLEAMKESRALPKNAKDAKEAHKKERTDEDIMKALEDRMDRQQKMLDTKKKYFNEFKKILTPRQLEKVFAPRPDGFRKAPGKPRAGKRADVRPCPLCPPCHEINRHHAVCPPCQK